MLGLIYLSLFLLRLIGLILIGILNILIWIARDIVMPIVHLFTRRRHHA